MSFVSEVCILLIAEVWNIQTIFFFFSSITGKDEEKESKAQVPVSV